MRISRLPRRALGALGHVALHHALPELLAASDDSLETLRLVNTPVQWFYPREFSDADPFKLIRIDPNEIAYVSNAGKRWLYLPGEVVAGGRKLVGSAQVVERGVLLQHGSLPLDGDTDRIARLLPYGTRPSAARLADLLPTLPSWETLVEALGAAWRTELALDLQPAATPPDVLAKFCEHHARFADPAWTWQR